MRNAEGVANHPQGLLHDVARDSEPLLLDVLFSSLTSTFAIINNSRIRGNTFYRIKPWNTESRRFNEVNTRELVA